MAFEIPPSFPEKQNRSQRKRLSCSLRRENTKKRCWSWSSSYKEQVILSGWLLQQVKLIVELTDLKYVQLAGRIVTCDLVSSNPGVLARGALREGEVGVGAGMVGPRTALGGPAGGSLSFIPLSPVSENSLTQKAFI